MLVVKKIGKSYNNRKVVSDLSINIARSQIVGLLGPNGAGKTTSFYMMVGLIDPSYGSITIDDQTDITKMPMYLRAKFGISYLPQESSVFRGLTVYENIMAVLEIIEPDKNKREIAVSELMEEFGISHLQNIVSSYLSGGERRRLEIARCIATKPKYLLLDEPFAGIDPIAVSEIKTMILKLKKDHNVGLLITEHNVKAALEILDYAYIMYDGKILAEGNTKQIIKDERVKKLYLGSDFV